MSQPVHIPASFADWRTLAQRRLPSFLFGYVDGGSLDEQTLDAQFDASVSWKDIEWLRSLWDGPILKGVLEVDDACTAADMGVQGVVVSNHGGRQLDGAVPTARAPPRIAEAMGGREMSILVDGGIRSGTDIIRARALGAQGVMVGRSWVYANAAGGQAGVTRWLGQMEHELATSLGLMGVADLNSVGGQHLAD